MKILHAASFLGNIGDNASHMGFKRVLNGFFSDYEITRMEIRKFYKNYNHEDKCFFDQNFITKANTYDLLVIGGGGFLDYWIKDSVTGTTLDLDPELLKFLDVPTLITSIGCNPHKDVPDGNIQKFSHFLDEMLTRPNIKIALRNDGSVHSFQNEIGVQYLDQLEEVLDNGFFYQPHNVDSLPIDREYVAVNITSDQIQMKSTLRGSIDSSSYYQQLAKSLAFIVLEKKLPVVLIPHIYSDLAAISALLSHMDDYLVREHIIVAPCVQNDSGADLLFSIYKNARLVMGMRYHANVCNMVSGKPIVGLVALDRVKYAYDYFGFDDRCLVVDGAFAEELMQKITIALNETKVMAEQYRQRVQKFQEQSIQTYSKMFSALGILVN